MLLQSSELSRLLIVFIPQLILAALFLFLAIKLLRRNQQRPTVTLGMLYIISASGLIFNAIFLLIAAFQPENEVLLLVIYFLTIFPLLLSPVFLLTFMLNLLKLGDVFTIKKQLIITLIYGFIISIIFFAPNGIAFSEQWRPIFSWGFLTLVYITLTVFILLPTFWYSRRLIKTFQDKSLKKKLMTFIIGIYGMLLHSFLPALQKDQSRQLSGASRHRLLPRDQGFRNLSLRR